MADRPGQKVLTLDGELFHIFVKGLGDHMAGSCDLTALSGHRQAPLPAGLLAVLLDDLRIDHDDRLVLVGAHIDHNDPLEHSYLRSRKSHAVRVIHCLLHIRDQLSELGRHLLYCLGFFAEHRVPQLSDHSKSHICFPPFLTYIH